MIQDGPFCLMNLYGFNVGSIVIAGPYFIDSEDIAQYMKEICDSLGIYHYIFKASFFPWVRD